MANRILAKIQTLFKNKDFVKYFYNTGWLMLDKILRLSLGLFIGVWVARYLGPEQFGVLNYAISFVAIFIAFGKLGLDSIIVRNIVREPGDRDVILGTSIVLRSIGSLTSLLVVFLALQLTSTNIFEKSLVIIIALGQLFLSFEVVDFYFQSQIKAKYSSIVNIIGLFTFSLIRILLIIFNFTLVYFAIAIVLEQIVKAFCFVVFYKKNSLFISKWKFSFRTARDLLRDSWPLILSTLVIMIYMRVDQIMIKELMSNLALGHYSAAVRLSEAWCFIPMVIANSVFPAIINAKKNNESLYRFRLQQFYQFMFVIAVFVSILIYFMSDWIINLLYGELYSEAGPVLMVHIWASVFVFIGVANSKRLINENLQIYLTINTTIGVIFNIVLNYFFIRNMGIIGAAIATLISQGVASYFSLLFFKKTKCIFFHITDSILFLGIFRKN